MKRRFGIVLAFSLTACGSSANSQGVATPATVSMAMSVGASNASALVQAPTATDAQGGSFTVEAAKVYVRDIKLQAKETVACDDANSTNEAAEDANKRLGAKDPNASFGCDGNNVVRVSGPFLIDLMSSEPNPALAQVNIPAVTYTRIDVRVDKADPREGKLAAGDPMAGTTLQASGTYQSGSSRMPFELALQFNEDVRFSNPDGIALGSGDLAQLVMKLDVQSWFSALPITKCVQDGNLDVSAGKLVITDGRGGCSALMNAIKMAVESSGHMSKEAHQ